MPFATKTTGLAHVQRAAFREENNRRTGEHVSHWHLRRGRWPGSIETVAEEHCSTRKKATPIDAGSHAKRAKCDIDGCALVGNEKGAEPLLIKQGNFNSHDQIPLVKTKLYSYAPLTKGLLAANSPDPQKG